MESKKKIQDHSYKIKEKLKIKEDDFGVNFIFILFSSCIAFIF